jgi:glycosyltransferase involved in cell wall biosynthesis
MRVTYISWAPHCTRSDHTARELGGTSHMVYWRALGSHPSTVWLKYFGQAVATWRILLRDQPDAIFVMSPPVFAALSVWAYSRIFRRLFVIDAHTAAFLHPRWRHFQRLQGWLFRASATTLVTNDHLAERVRAAGGHATLVPDVPVQFGSRDSYELPEHFNVAMVCSYGPDEPIAEMLRAAAALPDVRFHVTGSTKNLARYTLPPNVTSTGFLSADAYGSLLQKADAVLVLTTRDHTMLRGAWEAIYQGTPVIVSNWPILREAFDEGAVHTENTAPAIAEAVNTMRRSYPMYRDGALRLKHRKEQRWADTRTSLLRRLEASTPRPA